MQHQSEEKNSESMGIPIIADSVGQGILLSNATWEHLFDASPDFVSLISTDFRILRLNKALNDYFSPHQTQIIGKFCFEVFHHLQQPAEDCPILKMNGSGSVQVARMQNTVFGSAEIKAIPLLNAEGKPAGCIHIIRPEQQPVMHEELFSEQWPSLLDAIADPSLICDMNGRVLCSSASFLEMCGLKESSRVTGSNIVSFLIHDEIEKVLVGLHEIASLNKEIYTGRHLVRRSAREAMNAEITMKPLRKGSQTVAILISFRDISGQLELLESANRNQVRLSRFNRTFLSFSPDPATNINRLVMLLGEMLGASSCSFILLHEGKPGVLKSWQSPFCTEFNAELAGQMVLNHFQSQATDILVMAKPEIMGHYAEYPQMEQSGFKTFLGLPVKTGNHLVGMLVAGFTFHYQLRNDDREFCNMIVAAVVLENARISVPGTTDLNYRELFDFFTDSIYILSADGLFIDVNIGATRLFGSSRDELIGKTFLDLSAKDKNDQDAILQAITNAFNGESGVFEWWGVRKNGEVFPNDVVLNRGRYFGKDVVIAIGREISERKQVEEKLLRYNLELRETNQSKDKFFSILAHDLKNPFGGLLGFIDLLYEDIDELSTDQVKEYLQNIRTASYHTYSLLENLLEWSRIQTGKVQFRPSKFDLREEIESVVQVLEANAVRKNIKLLNLVPAGIEAEADRNMIHSVIQNLTANAIKFSNSNSTVTISGKFAAPVADTNQDGKSILKPGQWYEISVTDTGIGIPEDIMPKLFRLDGQFSMAGTANEPGTGLGLILCKEMVEKNGGLIRVESASGNGSTFAFTLPLSA